MFKKIFILFKIANKLAKSDALDIISKIHQLPFSIKFFFKIFSFFNKKKIEPNTTEEERLCNSLQEMGTTFIKL